MQHFKPRRSQNGKRTRYEFFPREQGKMFKLTIAHRDGGMNYFSGASEQRGVEIAVSQVEVSYFNGRPIESLMPADSVNGRLLVVESARYSPKKVDAVAEAFDEVAPRLSELFETDRPAAMALLHATAQKAEAAA